MKQNFLFVILFEFLISPSMAEESYLMMNTPNSPLSEYCSKTLHMNIISRSLLCHLLPSLKNLPFSWSRRNYKVIKTSDLDAMQSQTLVDDFAKYNNEFDDHIPNLELQQEYSPESSFHIPPSFSFNQQNHFPPKISEVSSSDFESIAPFAPNSQIIKPVSNSFETNLKSTLTSPNMQRGNPHIYGVPRNPSPDLNLASSMSKEQSYQSSPYSSMSSIDYRPLASRPHWWPTDKNVLSNNRDKLISLKGGKGTNKNVVPFNFKSKTNIAVDTGEGWSPISLSKSPNQLMESFTPTYRELKPVTFSPRVYYTTRSPTPSRSPFKNDYFRRDYLIDSNNDQVLVNNKEALNRNNKISKKSSNKPKTRTILPLIQKNHSIATTLVTEAINTNLAETQTTTPLTTTQTEISVKKEHTDYTKYSVKYSVNDSVQEKAKISGELNNNSSIKLDHKSSPDYIYYDTETKVNAEPEEEEIYSISDDNYIIDNKTSTISSEPAIDYPMFSSLTSTNFSCASPGFYADQEFGCQVYHHCGDDNYHQKFICPNGTLFNNQIQACDYWFNVKCEKITKSVKVTFDTIEDKLNVLGNTSRPSFNTTLGKSINVYENHKLIESLKSFVEKVKPFAINKTQIESKDDIETKFSNKH